MGRACYFNWHNDLKVDIDLSTILQVGSAYSIWDVRDALPGSTPIMSGTYGGGTVSFPTTQAADPAQSGSNWGVGGETAPPATAPFFNAFVVRRTS